MKQTIMLALASVLILIILHSFSVSCQISLPISRLELDAHSFSNISPSRVLIEEANGRLNKTDATKMNGGRTDRQTTVIIFRSCVTFEQDTL